MRPQQLHKVYLKCIDGQTIVWKFFCGIPEQLYQKYISAMDITMVDFNAYIAFWVKQDFNITLRMIQLKDTYQLKNAIVIQFRQMYPELYALEKYGVKPNKDFCIQYWLSLHMELEIKKKEEYMNDYSS